MTATVTQPNIDRSAFRAWLESKPPEEVVGNATAGGRCAECPIATWLRETWLPGALVSPGVAWTYDSEDVPLPRWASDFIEAADNVSRDHETVADCLRILDELPEFAS